MNKYILSSFKKISLISLVACTLTPNIASAGQCEFYHSMNGVMFAVRFAANEAECYSMAIPRHDHFGLFDPRSIGDEHTHTHSHEDGHKHSHTHTNLKIKPGQVINIKPSPITIQSTHTIIYGDGD